MHGLVKPKRSEIIEVPIEEIKPDPKNPRQHSRQQIRQVAASIQRFGFRGPILIDTHDGGRIRACAPCGMQNAWPDDDTSIAD
jgi:hypothetical protein